MNRSTLPTGLKTLKGWADKNTLRFDLPIQRNSGMWNNLQKSMLVYAILNEYPIPSLYLAKYKDENGTTYQAIDGKQRCTSLFEFINGEYALHPKTPPVTVDDTVFDLAGLFFEELSDECKDALLGFRFTIYCLEDATDEQIEEIFELINNSTPLSTIQKSKPKIGTELSIFLRGVLELSFWQESVNLTVAQMRREDNLLMLLQSALLLEASVTNYSYKSISAAECLKFCEYLHDNMSDRLKEELETLTIYLSDGFVGKGSIKYLRKNNVPVIFCVAKLAVEKGIEIQSYKAFLDDFFTTENEAYKEYSGSGNVKRVNTQGRLSELTKAFIQYYKLTEDICLNSADHAENSEVISGKSSSVEEVSEEEENPVSGDSDTSIGVSSSGEVSDVGSEDGTVTEENGSSAEDMIAAFEIRLSDEVEEETA